MLSEALGGVSWETDPERPNVELMRLELGEGIRLSDLSDAADRLSFSSLGKGYGEHSGGWKVLGFAKGEDDRWWVFAPNSFNGRIGGGAKKAGGEIRINMAEGRFVVLGEDEEVVVELEEKILIGN